MDGVLDSGFGVVLSESHSVLDLVGLHSLSGTPTPGKRAFVATLTHEESLELGLFDFASFPRGFVSSHT